MKKIILLLIFFVSILSVNAIDISTCEELQNISLNLTQNYTLINDIYCSDTINWNNGSGFIPISGNFIGTLDGQGYTIYDLYINKTTPYVGLFEKLYTYSIVTNLIIKDAVIYSNSSGYVGVLAGYSLNNYINDTKIIDFFIDAPLSSRVGGFFGYANSIINPKNLYSKGDITGLARVGGFSGEYYNIDLYDSFFDININCLAGYCGGVFGYYSSDSANYKIYRVGTKGSINGGQTTGGLIGFDVVYTTYYSNIFDCYSQMDINGINNRNGGLIGYHYSRTDIFRSYYSGNIINSTGALIGNYNGGRTGYLYYSYADSNNSEPIVLSGGSTMPTTGSSFKTTEQMKNQSTYDVSYNFSTVWNIYEPYTYPYLRSINTDLQVCIPDFSCNGYTECNNTQRECNSVIDNNYCGYVYQGDYTEFGTFGCYTPSYTADDIPKSLFDITVKFIIGFGLSAVIIALSFIYYIYKKIYKRGKRK